METFMSVVTAGVAVPITLLIAGGLATFVLGLALGRTQGRRETAALDAEMGREMRRVRRHNVLLSEERDKYREAATMSRRKGEGRRATEY
ncbi:MAG: hypothetical protein AAFZ09_05785 [Pseudomonadota bacterium]